MVDNSYFLKNTKKILVFLVITFVILLFLITIFVKKGSSDLKLDKRFPELFGNFTPYMKDYVILHLKAIDCDPTDYYDNNHTICFSCDGYYACFGFSWVNRSGGRKINIAGRSFLNGSFEIFDEVNFYSFGLSKLLRCKHNSTVNEKENFACIYNISLVMQKENNGFICIFLESSNEPNIIDLIMNLDDELDTKCIYDGVKHIICGPITMTVLDNNSVVLCS